MKEGKIMVKNVEIRYPSETDRYVAHASMIAQDLSLAIQRLGAPKHTMIVQRGYKVYLVVGSNSHSHDRFWSVRSRAWKLIDEIVGWVQAPRADLRRSLEKLMLDRMGTTRKYGRVWVTEVHQYGNIKLKRLFLLPGDPLAEPED